MNNPGWYASGIMVGLIGPAAGLFRVFKANQFPKIYEIKGQCDNLVYYLMNLIDSLGQFGLASRTFRDDGKIFMKATYKHIKREYYERILSKIEAAQRGEMFKMAGIDLRSEEAHKVASGAMALPPTTQTKPIIYAVRSVHFELPDFTIQVQCINEQEEFLAELINEIGLAVKSVALCTGIRCIQYGPFTVEHALLDKHWTLENIIENIHYCKDIVNKHRILERPHKKRQTSS